MGKYLAFDLGASSGRAMVGELKNNNLILQETHRFPNRMVYLLGHYHWDILQLIDEIKTGLAKTAAAGHHDILSIGIDTWGVDFGLVGKGVLLGNPYAYRDMTTDKVMQRSFNAVPREEMYKKTGIQFMPFNSIFQLYRLVEDQHPLLDVAETLLFIPDLLNFFLTGEKLSEYTIASTSQLLDPWNKTWSTDLFDKLGLPLQIMADIAEPGTLIGQLRKDIAEETGMPRVKVIAPGCHDTASAVAAVPGEGDHWAYLSSGTWSLMGVEADEPIINADALANNFTNEGGVGHKIRFLKNIAGLWLVQRCKSDWAKEGEDFSYDELTQLAEQAGAARSFIDPDDPRFANPTDMPSAIVKYCRDTDQNPPQTKGEIVRCALESLARKYHQIINNMNSMLPHPITRLHLVGGGTQNQLLNQLAANATGISVTAGPVEATALGNIVVQAIACEEIDSIHTARELIRKSFSVQTINV